MADFGILEGIALASAIIGGGSAIYSANQQSSAVSSQKQAYNLQQAYNRQQNTLDFQKNRIATDYALEVNAADQLKTNAILKTYGLQSELYDAMGMFAAQRYGIEQSLINLTADIVGKKYAAENEIYEWQLATLDWEAGFKESQAQNLDTQGALARELFGVETAKLIAKQRARMAASGLEMGEGSPVDVLGNLAGERQFESDVMKYATDVAVYDKRYEAASLLNEKNRVRAGQYISGLEYLGDMGNLAARAGGSAIDYNATTAELWYKRGALALDKDVAQSNLGLLQSQRKNIMAGADIDLNKYNLAQRYGTQAAFIQNDIYNTTQSSITGGAAFNVGSAAFNSANSYYATTNKGGTTVNNYYYGS